jgi:hypothetical protein
MDMTAIVVDRTSFRDTYADGRPKFVVRKDMGNGTYQCISQDDMDYNGVVRYYDADQIADLIGRDKMFDRLDGQRAGFWATRTVGEVLHYNNAFGKFVRGVVVLVGGEHKLKPTALVGKWNGRSDLPHRRPNGEISYPYHADKVINGGDDAAWQPSDGCVYESPTYSSSYARDGDPRTMPAIDLTVPDMTPAEQETANLEQALDRVRKILEDRYQTSAPPREVLAAIEDEVRGFNGF